MARHPLVNSIFQVLLNKGFEGAFILEVEQDEGIIKVKLALSYQSDLDDLKEILDNLKMEIKAHDVVVHKTYGKIVELLFGTNVIDKGLFPVNKETISNYVKEGTLKITLPSSFGIKYLDFEDGGSCHMLNGGTTRMGKTSLMLYMMTVLYIQNKENIKFYVCSSKKKDFYPFYDFDVEFAKNPIELLEILALLTNEYDKRNDLLESKELRKATDSKSVRKYYPHYSHHFKPIFLLIDEYADYSHIADIQLAVENLVRKAGFINIHVIIATQRADARTTIPPSIKCCLSARICFTTTDKNNSIVILDQEGAEDLRKIEGRAIFLDGVPHIIQVPYLEAADCDEILEEYRKGEEHVSNENEKRSEHTTGARKVQSLFEESIGILDLPGECKPDKHNKQGNEKTMSGWHMLEYKKDKR